MLPNVSQLFNLANTVVHMDPTGSDIETLHRGMNIKIARHKRHSRTTSLRPKGPFEPSENRQST